MRPCIWAGPWVMTIGATICMLPSMCVGIMLRTRETCQRGLDHPGCSQDGCRYEWNARRQRTHDDRPKEESIRFGQRNHLEPWGRKSPSIASLIDSDDSIEPEEKLRYGRMDTAAPEGAFKMTNFHCKLLVLISKYGQMPVADEPETWICEIL